MALRKRALCLEWDTWIRSHTERLCQQSYMLTAFDGKHDVNSISTFVPRSDAVIDKRCRRWSFGISRSLVEMTRGSMDGHF